jgi:hypothetical protein
MIFRLSQLIPFYHMILLLSRILVESYSGRVYLVMNFFKKQIHSHCVHWQRTHTASIRIDFPPDDRCSPCQEGNLFSTFTPTYIKSVEYNFILLTGMSRYFIGKTPSLQFRSLTILALSSPDTPNTITMPPTNKSQLILSNATDSNNLGATLDQAGVSVTTLSFSSSLVAPGLVLWCKYSMLHMTCTEHHLVMVGIFFKTSQVS